MNSPCPNCHAPIAIGRDTNTHAPNSLSSLPDNSAGVCIECAAVILYRSGRFHIPTETELFNLGVQTQGIFYFKTLDPMGERYNAWRNWLLCDGRRVVAAVNRRLPSKPADPLCSF